ncbi:acetyltransferase [Domibacillus epiphyticus]|uniref:Acetyltransferase n=1 Tax=Domibacillus epiphyticus TaxID=1714355 RepID=A0A1V2A6S6_9BACI|nr:acetyltransferase [Domibacillus epiphyticus]OMP66637.1 acetyltransferase [Domibacillus epiphyticus]
MKPIVVIGEGGHSKAVQDVILAEGRHEVIAILDDKNVDVFEREGVLFGPISYAEKLTAKTDAAFVVAIGNNHIREKIAMMLLEFGAAFEAVVHPFSSVSPSACIGEGTVIMAGSVINADAVIGKHVIINSSSVVEHDNHIGDFAHISPGAVLTGNVQVGKGAHIGASATVVPGQAIGDWSIVGAGAVVIEEVPDGVTVVGVPARLIGKKA